VEATDRDDKRVGATQLIGMIREWEQLIGMMPFDHMYAGSKRTNREKIQLHPQMQISVEKRAVYLRTAVAC
jgi:hypothetical protein